MLDVLRRSDVPIDEDIGTGTYRLLFRVLASHPEEVRSFYEDTVAPLVAYDAQYSTDLVGTLSAYLERNCNMNATASAIYAHRHTVAYRLGAGEGAHGARPAAVRGPRAARARPEGLPDHRAAAAPLIDVAPEGVGPPARRSGTSARAVSAVRAKSLRAVPSLRWPGAPPLPARSLARPAGLAILGSMRCAMDRGSRRRASPRHDRGHGPGRLPRRHGHRGPGAGQGRRRHRLRPRRARTASTAAPATTASRATARARRTRCGPTTAPTTTTAPATRRPARRRRRRHPARRARQRLPRRRRRDRLAVRRRRQRRDRTAATATTRSTAAPGSTRSTAAPATTGSRPGRARTGSTPAPATT